MQTDDPDRTTGRKSGLRPTRQAPVSPAATLDLDEATVSEVWRDLLVEDAVAEAFVRAVRSFAKDRTPADLLNALEERDVPEHLHAKIDAVARGDRRRAVLLLAAARGLGGGRSTVDDLLATASLFDALPDADAPTLAVHAGQPFRERRREQRESVLELVATLAQGFDCRLVAGRLTRAWLAREHREYLPGVSEWRNTRRDRSPLSDRVADALATLDPDGRQVSVLRDLADEPAGTLSYHNLYSSASVGKSRVRQVVGDLEDLGLVATFGSSTGRQVEILEAGREYLDEIGRQSTLSEPLAKPDSTVHRPCNPANGKAPPDGDAAEQPPDRGPYRTRYLGRAGHHAAASAAPDGGVGMVRAPLDGDTDRDRLVSFDEERDEAVLSVRATGPLQYTVSTALALASPRFLDAALPPDRLDAIDDPPAILRDARCVGWLSDEALEDAATLRDALVDAGEKIADLTTDLKRGEYDDRNQHRSDIMRSAHGLAGSIVHLLDAVGVDLVREVRVPGKCDRDHLEGLARSAGISAAIQARYGAFAVYRQLFESRQHKRSTALKPTVDAMDPLGTLIGSFTFRGPDVHRLRDHLERHLGTPRDLVEDAPEIAVHVPIAEADRPAFATVATRLLETKNLRPTRDAVSILQALAGSPHAVADALNQLAPEEHRRDVRPDEVRYALATLPTDRLVPDLEPTVGKIVAALLRAEDPLTQADLADAADVSTRSVRRNADHLERLAALGLVDADGDTYRLALSFRTEEERRSPVTPDAPDRFVDAVDGLLARTLPTDRYADPEDPVAGALFYPPEPWGIVDEDTGLESWIHIAAALTGTDRPDGETTVSIGPEPDQTPLPGTQGDTVAAG